MTSRLTLAFAFILMAQAAPAQDASAFQTEMIETANAAGSARLPVACAGLFHALSQASDNGSDDATTMSDKESDAAVVAIISRSKETGDDNDTATTEVIGFVDAVAEVYIRWFAMNLETSDGILDDTIRDNYQYCERLRGEWVAAMGG